MLSEKDCARMEANDSRKRLELQGRRFWALVNAVVKNADIESQINAYNIEVHGSDPRERVEIINSKQPRWKDLKCQICVA